ncbi:MAG TPA: MlaD family protein [Mucilaginibacter sp.]|jgi:phospholipid/cholesterol/gamma-HCH transport system substrate-binding protein
MKITSGQKIKIGLFTFIGLLALVLAIFFIGNKRNLFSSTFSIYGTFRNVNGLQKGNNVRLVGINVGAVQAINIVTDSSARVDLIIDNKVKKFIKKDSKLSIGSDGLMGDKLVVISPGGVTTTEAVRNGDQLAAVNPIDIDKIVNKITGVVTNAESLTAGLSQIVAKVNNGQGSIGRLLNSSKLSRDLEGTVRQAKTTMQNVHKTTTTLNTDLKAAQSNFLLKGFFKKKKKAQEDSIKKAKAAEANKQ